MLPVFAHVPEVDAAAGAAELAANAKKRSPTMVRARMLRRFRPGIEITSSQRMLGGLV
jgi:hypothetical protein